MAIKLYGAVVSTNTLRVMACLAEKDLHYEFINIDLSNKEHKSPGFLSRNPFGQVPAFEDGDLKLFVAFDDENTDVKKPLKKNEITLPIIMAIKLYGAVVSTNTLRVMACLAEKDLHYEFINIDLSNKEHKSPGFLSRNPFGQVPAFEDGDLKLFGTKIIIHINLLVNAKRLFDARPHVSAWAAEILSRPAWVKASSA
ncbi:hypothetical protein M8C21_006722 [Ambrosia artemisiifolia]|uniref:glutathione transferase n=1 Tax=Ambrosia artemisiifolia TaxID=4212 RepID=A0AAD5CPG9_AMBAR|nr:hypothetical protein M8C21_006722 [Ambrosia artemisiifolia]